MFSILPTVTGQTVTITGNYGASTCDTTIATAKVGRSYDNLKRSKDVL